MKERFIEIFTEHIHREGADKLLNYLLQTDFFEAPASTRFHLSEPSGGEADTRKTVDGNAILRAVDVLRSGRFVISGNCAEVAE